MYTGCHFFYVFFQINNWTKKTDENEKHKLQFKQLEVR